MTISARELVSHWAHQEAERTAVLLPNESVSYASLHKSIAERAAILKQLGIRPGAQVALSFPNSIEFIIWLFAIFESDLVACPLDPKLSSPEVQQLLDRGEIDCLAGVAPGTMTHWHQLDSLPDASGHLWCRSTDVQTCKTVTGAVLRQFTSGSTGQAKHILRTDKQLTEDYSHFCTHLDLHKTERFLGVAPFYHAFGALGLLASLSLGATIIPMPRFFPGELLAAACLYQPTMLLASPPIIELLGRCLLGENEDKAFANLRYCICSTGRLTDSASSAFTTRYHVPVSTLYGSSETLSATIDLELEFESNRVGKPFPGVEFRIFDDVGGILKAGDIGRIGLQSPAACTQYAQSDKALVCIDDFILLGDRGYSDQSGNLYVLGRDDQINIGGYKVDRTEIEIAIRENLPVSYVAVLPYHRAGQPALRAVVEADPEEVTVALVTRTCKDHLANYKVPARVEIYPRLPRDANGKVLVAKLDSEEVGSTSIEQDV